jgi:hypothetical protein
MAILLFARCEGSTLDGTHDYSPGDTSWTLNNASFTTTAPKVGSNSLAITASGGQASLSISSQDLIQGDEGALGFWFRVATWQAGGDLITANNTGNETIRVYMTGTDELEYRYRTVAGDNVAITTTAANIAVDTFYFVVARWHFANDDMALEVYNTDAGAVDHSVSNLNTGFGGTAGTLYSQLVVGTPGANISQAYFDNIMIGDTYAEPLQDYRMYTSYTQLSGGGATIVNRETGRRGIGRGVLRGV